MPIIRKLRWCQFSLAGMLVFTTVACMAFAILGAFGVKGTTERVFAALFFAAPFSPFSALAYHWWRTEHDNNPNSRPIRDLAKIVLMFLVGEWIAKPPGAPTAGEDSRSKSEF